jgi:hypothetical protein
MQIVQSAVKSILIKAETEFIVGALCLQFPFLGLPIIRQIVSFFVSEGIKKSVEAGSLALYIAQVTNLKDNQGEALKKSIQELEEAKSDEDKARAKQKVIDDFRKFGKLTPR